MPRGRKKKLLKKHNEAKDLREKRNTQSFSSHTLSTSSASHSSRWSRRARPSYSYSRYYLLISMFGFVKQRTPSKLRVIIPELSLGSAFIVFILNCLIPGFGMCIAAGMVRDNKGNLGQSAEKRKETCQNLNAFGLLHTAIFLIYYTNISLTWIFGLLWGVATLVMAVKVILEKDQVEIFEVATLVEETRSISRLPEEPAQSTEYPNQHALRLNDHTHN